MINLDEIDKTILELEQHDTTYATIEKLAWLYTVRNHLTSDSQKETASTGTLEGTEFCQLCSEKPLQGIMAILAEHMEIIKAIYPKEYSAILRRINDL